MSEPSNEGPASSPQRLVALGDGVFAIVMTLLVFQLGVPLAAEVRGDGELSSQLVEMWPEFLIYGLSFLVLGVFWLIHHLVFDVIERYDTTLIWLNIVFLMFAALIPFSSRLFGEHGATSVTALVYGINMLVVFAMGWAIFSYATRRERLVANDFDAAVERGGNVMGLVYMLFMVPAVAVSFLSPVAAFALYGLLVLAIIVFTVIGKAEVVMIWPVRSPSPAPLDTADDARPR